MRDKLSAIPAAWVSGLVGAACLCLSSVGALRAEPRTIRVFVALCDNATQGILPVPAKIGDGENPDANLYWGCNNGLRSFFRRSKVWKLDKAELNPTPEILERVSFKHVSDDLMLIGEAYRGREMRRCLADFEACLASGGAGLAAYIGHNGSMDEAPGETPATTLSPGQRPDAVVLCCVSQRYFAPRLEALGARPVLLTQQLMYPGAFLLHDAIEAWRRGASRPDIRAAAGRAYAKNQGISTKAGTGIFAPLE